MDLNYDIAEWLLFNEKSIKQDSKIQLAYTKAKGFKDRAESIELVMDYLADVVKQYHPHLSIVEIDDIMRDERVMIIIDKYFLGEWVYEH